MYFEVKYIIMDMKAGVGYGYDDIKNIKIFKWVFN